MAAEEGLSLHMIFEGRQSRAFCYNPTARKLWVRFNPRLDSVVGFAPPAPQMTAIAAGFASIWVQTAVNDYYLNDDLAELRRAMYDFTARFDYVACTGFSMGGFGALLLSKALRLRQAVLVSPQRLGFPRQFPYRSPPEVEQAIYRQGGDPALDGVSPELRGMLLFDPFTGRGRDRTYADHLRTIAPGLVPVPLPGGGHPATNVLHEAKLFGQFQRAVLQVPPKPGKVRAIHRKARRSSDKYIAFLAAYLDKRAARNRKGHAPNRKSP